MSQLKRYNVLLGVALFFFVLGIAALLLLQQAERAKDEIPVYGEVPEFTFVNQDGEPFGLADMTGRVNVVDFIFTNCKSACPIMRREMSQLYEAFETERVQFVSISVDPARDTEAVLRAYREGSGVTDDRWQFLHAPVDSVIWLSEEGFMLPADNLPMGHSSRFALVDSQGRIRGYYNALEEKPMIAIKEQITRLLALEEEAGLVRKQRPLPDGLAEEEKPCCAGDDAHQKEG